MELSDREKQLVIAALVILEWECAGDELHYEIEHDLGGTPKSEEVRALISKIKQLQAPPEPEKPAPQNIMVREGDEAFSVKSPCL